MVSMGQDGYRAAAQKIIDTVRQMEATISQMDELVLLGTTDSGILCFGPRDPSKLDILRLGDAMMAKGWSLDHLHRPACLRFCVGLVHAELDTSSKFAVDIVASVAQALEAPAGPVESTMREDEDMVAELSTAFLDALYET